MSTSLFDEITHSLQVIETELGHQSPVVEVIGVSDDVIQNILPVLFPTIYFREKIQDSENCPDIHASLFFEGDSICQPAFKIHVLPTSVSFQSKAPRAKAIDLLTLHKLNQTVYDFLDQENIRLF